MPNSNTYESVLSRREVDPATGCWNWVGAGNGAKFQYGRVIVNGVRHLVPRISAFVHKGLPLDSENCVLHICDNPRCFNPDHLFFGDRGDNVHDCETKRRGNHPTREAHGRAKLTMAQAREIRSLQGKATDKELALAFHVSPGLIWQIHRNRIWREA